MFYAIQQGLQLQMVGVLADSYDPFSSVLLGLKLSLQKKCPTMIDWHIFSAHLMLFAAVLDTGHCLIIICVYICVIL